MQKQKQGSSIEVQVPAELKQGVVGVVNRRLEYVNFQFQNSSREQTDAAAMKFIVSLNHPVYKVEDKMEEWVDLRPEWLREGDSLTLSLTMFRDIRESDPTPVPDLFKDLAPKVSSWKVEELTLSYPKSGETYDSITNAFKEFLAKEEANPKGWRSGRQGVRLDYKKHLLELSLQRDIS